jgi:hypothetical protein
MKHNFKKEINEIGNKPLSSFFNAKRVCFTLSMLGAVNYYMYTQHVRKQKIMNRMNYLLTNKIPLSGVYLQNRPPFKIWFLRWFLPYHQSLKIVDFDTHQIVRYVGLGSFPYKNSVFERTAVFVHHTGEKYENLNNLDISIPIECWIDYEDKFGHFPENINTQKLTEITKTFDEKKSNEPIYTTNFLSYYKNKTLGFSYFSTCQSAVMWAIRTEELERKN